MSPPKLNSKFIILFIALLAFMPGICQADLFINRNKDKQETESPAYKPPTTQNKKPAQSSNAPSTIKQFANAYYQNCKQQQHPVLKDDNLELLCACSSAKITQTMTLQNIRDMTADTALGLKQRNRLLTEVYVPCMEYPTKALLMSSCMKDPAVGKALKHPQKVCDCMSSSVSQYIVREAPNAAKKAIASNSETTDPLAALLNSQDYEQQSQAYLLGCLQKHELGLQ